MKLVKSKFGFLEKSKCKFNIFLKSFFWTQSKVNSVFGKNRFLYLVIVNLVFGKKIDFWTQSKVNSVLEKSKCKFNVL